MLLYSVQFFYGNDDYRSWGDHAADLVGRWYRSFADLLSQVKENLCNMTAKDAMQEVYKI